MASSEKAGLARNQVIAQLAKSPHGKLEEYTEVGRAAAAQDPDFFAHLVAWNHASGQVRDAKVALPVLSLASMPADAAWARHRESALAALAALSPRDLVRATPYARELGLPSSQVRRLVEACLRRWENPKTFERTAAQHRGPLKRLYSAFHLRPADHVRGAIGSRPAGAAKGPPAEPTGLAAAVRSLRQATPVEAAGLIATLRIPFLVAQGALGEKARDPVLVAALVEAMTPTELVSNAKQLEKMGARTDPVVRAAFERKLAEVSESRKAPTLKTSVAARAVGGRVGEQLAGAQERQIKRSVDGDWLLAVDRSPSMRESLEVAKHVAAALARFVSGKVHMVFFDSAPSYKDVTGKTLEEIQEATKNVVLGSGTSIGCALAYARERGLNADGVAVVTDGGECVVPWFAPEYGKLCESLGKEPPVYVYLLKGDQPRVLANAQAAGIEMQVLDLRGGVDYYSLPNLVQTMRTNRYSLADEIMETPLLKLQGVLRAAV